MSKAVPALLPALAGAIAALAVVLLGGWPGRPPLTGIAPVTAAVAVAVVAVLLVARAAAAGRRRAVRQAPPVVGLPRPLPAQADLLAA